DGQVEKFVNQDAKFVKWTGPLVADVARIRSAEFDPSHLRVAMYRPFSKETLYFDSQFNHRQGQLRQVFPSSETHNFGFYITAPGAGHDSSPLMTNAIPDLALWGSGSGQFLPRYTYRELENDPTTLFPGSGTLPVFDEIEGRLDLNGESQKYERVDNITDEIL